MRTYKLALTAVALLFLSPLTLVQARNVQNISLQISQKYLGAPFYRSRFQLSLNSSSMQTGNVSVKFLDKYARPLDIKDGIKIKRSDYSSCANGRCRADIVELSLALEKHSCFIEVNFSSPAGQVYLSETHEWGDCLSAPVSPNPKYLPDFSFPESAYFSDDSTIEIQNIGNGYLQRPLTVWGFLMDKEGKIIWSDTYSNQITINSQEISVVSFQNPIKVWQRHLACTGFFIIDPEFISLERTKLNNSIFTEYGACEDVPSEANNDKIDFQPQVEFSGNQITLNAVNNGRLAYQNDLTRLESYVRYLGQNRELIRVRNLFTDPDIQGFGDSKMIMHDSFPTGTCFIEIELNPNITIKESNYINNRIEFRVCE